MTTNVVLTLLIYLLTCASSVSAITLAMLERHRHQGLAALLAVAALVVSGMGLTRWTPLGFFPEFVWSLASGPFEISIRSWLLFIVPLVLAAFASFLTLRNHAKQRNEA
jgi:uncharacterized SAM-binding protein YcdF (DUF218 family)